MRTIPYRACRGICDRQSLNGFVIALLLLACLSTPAFSRVIDGVAIVVNRDAVLVSEINEALLPLLQEYRSKYAGAELQKKMSELREMIIKKAIETKLVLQVAKVNGITADAKAVDNRLEVVKGRFPSEDEFLRALTAKNLTYREYRDQVEEQILVQDTIKRVLGRQINAQDDELKEYYETHRDEFETEPRIKLAQIFLKIARDDAPEDIQKARQRAEQLRVLIEDGMDFAELAGKYSEGPYSDKGGLVGLVGPQDILPELEDVAFGLKTGEVSRVAETAYGFHILKALEASPARKIGFEEAKPLIEERIQEKKRSEKYDEWIDLLKKDSYIDIRI